MVLSERNFSSILNKILQELGWSEVGAFSNICQAGNAILAIVSGN
jgi:hypothetical protein